jgi:hypothetical protein
MSYKRLCNNPKRCDTCPIVYPESRGMNTNALRMNWLIPALGVALVGGGYALAKAYIRIEEESRSASQSGTVVDCLLQDYKLNHVLKQLQGGGCTAPAARLEALLAIDRTAIESQLGSVDPRTRALAAACFDTAGRPRARSSEMAAGLMAGADGARFAAARNLTPPNGLESRSRLPWAAAPSGRTAAPVSGAAPLRPRHRSAAFRPQKRAPAPGCRQISPPAFFFALLQPEGCAPLPRCRVSTLWRQRQAALNRNRCP